MINFFNSRKFLKLVLKRIHKSAVFKTVLPEIGLAFKESEIKLFIYEKNMGKYLIINVKDFEPFMRSLLIKILGKVLFKKMVKTFLTATKNINLENPKSNPLRIFIKKNS